MTTHPTRSTESPIRDAGWWLTVGPLEFLLVAGVLALIFLTGLNLFVHSGALWDVSGAVLGVIVFLGAALAADSTLHPAMTSLNTVFPSSLQRVLVWVSDVLVAGTLLALITAVLPEAASTWDRLAASLNAFREQGTPPGADILFELPSMSVVIFPVGILLMLFNYVRRDIAIDSAIGRIVGLCFAAALVTFVPAAWLDNPLLPAGLIALFIVQLLAGAPVAFAILTPALTWLVMLPPNISAILQNIPVTASNPTLAAVVLLSAAGYLVDREGMRSALASIWARRSNSNGAFGRQTIVRRLLTAFSGAGSPLPLRLPVYLGAAAMVDGLDRAQAAAMRSLGSAITLIAPPGILLVIGAYYADVGVVRTFVAAIGPAAVTAALVFGATSFGRAGLPPSQRSAVGSDRQADGHRTPTRIMSAVVVVAIIGFLAAVAVPAYIEAGGRLGIEALGVVVGIGVFIYFLVHIVPYIVSRISWLVWLAVIGALVAVALPNYQNYMERAGQPIDIDTSQLWQGGVVAIVVVIMAQSVVANWRVRRSAVGTASPRARIFRRAMQVLFAVVIIRIFAAVMIPAYVNYARGAELMDLAGVTETIESQLPLFVFALGVMIFLVWRWRRTRPATRDDVPIQRRVGSRLRLLAIPTVVVILLVAGLASLSEAAAIAAILAFGLGGTLREPMAGSYRALVDAGMAAGAIIFLVGVVSYLSTLLALTGAGDVLRDAMLQTAIDPQIAILGGMAMTAVGAAILGPLGGFLIAALILMPVVDDIGIEPLYAVIGMVHAAALGTILPYLGVEIRKDGQAILGNANLASAAVIPYATAFAIGLLAIIAFPELVLYLPNEFFN